MGVAVGAAKYRELLADSQSIVTIKNIIPYSIGLANDGRFKRYIKRNELAGFELPFKPLLIKELQKNNWCISIYQSFSNELELPLDGESAIFMADVKLDKSLYSAKDAISFKMKMSEDGKLHMSFFEQQMKDDEPEIVLVEEKIIGIGE